LHVPALGEDLEHDQQKRAASKMRTITFYELENFIGLPRMAHGAEAHHAIGLISHVPRAVEADAAQATDFHASGRDLLRTPSK
jgi:hypothetical protein